MSRPIALFGALAVIAGLIAPITPVQAATTEVVAKAELQPADVSPNIVPAPVQPDVAYTTGQGGRVEVYTSIGDNDGGIDWRQVNEFAYLLNSVPKGKRLYATVYNSLWDGDQAKKVSGKWELFDSTGKVKRGEEAFGPAQALRNQLNQYDTAADRKKYINILLSKKSMRDALASGSGLASLIYKAKDSSEITVKECKRGFGACLSTTTEEELMHAKYALFEQAKDSTGKTWDNVVWITSANLNGASGGKKSNTSLALFGDPIAYSDLLNKVWDAEVKEKFTTGYMEAIPGIIGTNSDFRFYPSPRSNKSTGSVPDYEAGYLESRSNSKLGGTKSECRAYLVHSLFSETRSRILTALANLQKEGCAVKIVLGENAIGAIVTTYFNMSSKVRDLIDRVEFSNVHDKTLTLSYKLNGLTYGTTYGGSANFNGTSLRYDELAFRADDLTLTRAVEQQSERLYLLSRGGEPTIAVKKVTVLPEGPVLNVDRTVQLRTRISPTNASVTQVTWKSSNTNVATVNAATGAVKAVGAGTAKLTATSVSGKISGSTTVTVNSDLPEQNVKDPGASALVVSSPPTMSMPNYQAPGGKTTVVVTWGQGDKDITGKVTMQYYSSGKWKSWKSFTVSKGRVEKTFSFTGSKTWRLRADSVSSPSKASITSTGKYSHGYSYIVVRTAASATKPRLWAAPMVKKDATIPMVVAWKNSSTSKIIRIQYKSGSKWKTKAEFTMAGSVKTVGVISGTTKYWRVLGVRKGATSTASSSIYVKMT